MNIEQARFNMVEQQVRPWLVSDPHTLELLGSIHREDFCPAQQRYMAFMDLEIPLPGGEVMLAPRVQARMVQDLLLKPSDKVLQIGAGTGYMTAMLARTAASVMAYEIKPELAEMARTNLQRAGIAADVRTGDGLAQVAGTFDAIVLCGSVASVPDVLVQHLAPQGRLLAVIGNQPIMHVQRITRHDDGNVQAESIWDVVIPRLHGLPKQSAFRF